MRTDVAVRNAKPKERPFKLADERALYLLVMSTGGKLWRLDYRFGDKRKTIALGAYPDVSLARARENRDEVLGVRVDSIEHQLAHAVRDPLGRAYNRTAHLAERRKMMQKWADYCDGFKAGAEVVSLRDRCRRN